MPTTITIIRHGVTVWNQQGRAQGRAPVPLSDQGHLQARRLAEALAEQKDIAAIYSSDLLRCRQTAAPIAAALGLPIRFDARFQEIDLGSWQGLTREEWQAYDPAYYAHLASDPVNVPFPDGENRPMLARRVMAGLADVLAACPGAHVLLVTHGGPIRAILRHYDLWPYRPWGEASPPVHNTSRTTIHVADDGRSAVPGKLLDVSHLSPDLISGS